jgi:hypothetical protein
MIPSRSHRYTTLIALVIFLLAGIPAVSGVQVALGETVPLSGYSPGSQWAYLFLTGPNLPANGVMLNDITQRADQGQFTRVEVDSNDHWSYPWNTGNVGGRLDEGTYTIWVANGPNDLLHLAEADYRTISVTLKKPSIAVDTQQQYGAMEITSSPSGASVSLNDQFRGKTPLTVQNLPPGTYQVTFTHPGYSTFSTPVSVQEGRVSEVIATLVLLQDIPAANTTNLETPTSPVTTTIPPHPTQKSAGFLTAIFLTGVLFLVREMSGSR